MLSSVLTFLSSLAPLSVKLWLVGNSRVLSKYVRWIAKRRQSKTEPSRLNALIANCIEEIAPESQSAEASTNPKINVISIVNSETAEDGVCSPSCEEVDYYHISVNDLAADSLRELIATFGNSEYVCFQKEGDRFLPNALQFLSKRLEKTKPDLVYWDNTFITADLKRDGHYFKPKWSPDYLLCFNYIDRAAAMKVSVLSTSFYQLAQTDWQVAIYTLFLSRVKQPEGQPPLHISKPLQELMAEKEEVSHARRHRETSEITKLMPDLQLEDTKIGIRVVSREARSDISCSIIIPTRDGYQILKKCIDSILQSDIRESDEIIIVDNQSKCEKTLNYLEELRNLANVRVLNFDFPFNYSSINNFAVSQVDSEVIVLLNNDVEIITTSWLQDLKVNAVRSEVGCVGAKLFYPDGTIQHGGVILGYGGVADHAFKYELTDSPGYMYRLQTDQNYSAVTAACLAVKKDIYEAVGGLEETRLAVAFNDIDFCLKVRSLNKRNLWLSRVELVHYESKSRGRDVRGEALERFVSEIAYMKERWSTSLKYDPYYSKSLSLKSHDFIIK